MELLAGCVTESHVSVSNRPTAVCMATGLPAQRGYRRAAWLVLAALVLLGCTAAKQYQPPAVKSVPFPESPVLSLLSRLPVVQLVTAQLDEDQLPDLLIVHAIATEWDYPRSEIYAYLSKRRQIVRIDRFDHQRRSNWPVALAAGDVDGDGRTDILLVNHRSGEVSWQRNRGLGQFASEQTIYADTVAYGFSDIQLGDVNEDGRVDLIINRQRTKHGPDAGIDILLNQGKGRFHAEPRLIVGQNPTRAYVSDLDGDHHLDLVVVDSFQKNYVDEISVLHGAGDGTFLLPPITTLSIKQETQRLILIDFEKDSLPEIIALSSWESKIQIFPNLGRGLFSDHHDIYAGKYARNLIAVDLDHDGQAELVSTTGLSVRIYQCDKTTKAWTLAAEINTPGAGPITAADFDNDGYVDIIVTSPTGLTLLRGQATGWPRLPKSIVS